MIFRPTYWHLIQIIGMATALRLGEGGAGTAAIGQAENAALNTAAKEGMAAGGKRCSWEGRMAIQAARSQNGWGSIFFG